MKQVVTFRLDSEFYLKRYVEELQLIQAKEDQFTNFKQLGLKIDASAFYPGLEPYYNKGAYPFIRVADVDNFIDYESCITIPDEIVEKGDFSTLKKVKEGDVLITKGGSIGRVALVEREAAVTRDLIFINSSLLESYEYKFLYMYLNTSFCNDLMVRSSSMTAQPHLTLTLIRDLPLFNPSEKFKKNIAGLFDRSVKCRNKSLELYLQAKNLLLRELNLENFSLNDENVSIKTLRESFLKTGRLDSEYYQPKYDEYLNKIYSYSGGYDLLSNYCNLKDQNYIPEDEKEYKYIELANIKGNAEIVDSELILGKDLPTRARRLVKEGDVIVSSIEGSLDSCGLITNEYNNALCSNGFYVIDSDVINPETLLILFKSELMLNLMKKGCSGTILTNITKEEFLKLPIPLIKSSVQEEIADYVSQSLSYTQKAKDLINISTQAVEIAIDKDEQMAQNFLDRQTDRQTDRQNYFIRLAIFRLYEELGLFDDLKSVNYTIKNFSKTFARTGRLDSEFYQEKYSRLYKKLGKVETDKLKNLVDIKKSIEPGSSAYQEEGIPFVRVQDLTKYEIAKPIIHICKEEFVETIRPKKDTILLSKDGSIGIAYKVDEDKNFVTSSAILHLNVKSDKVLPDYLTLVLNSFIVKMQAEQDAGGSIINHWQINEIKDVVIPILDMEKQEKISSMLIESHSLRKNSKALLDKAIKAVEIAIESGEAKALEFLLT
ncbi:restriction endonuclease subunit S [Enterococcus hirae]